MYQNGRQLSLHFTRGTIDTAAVTCTDGKDMSLGQLASRALSVPKHLRGWSTVQTSNIADGGVHVENA